MSPKIVKAYKEVARIASPSVAEGLKKERAILLLWFLRNVWAIDDLDAYEYVCDGEGDKGVDAMYVDTADGGESVDRLVIFQSKYPESPKNVGINELKSFAGTAEQFGSRESIEALLLEGVEPELKALIERLDVLKRLDKGTLKLKMVFVTAGVLTPEARQYVKTLNKKHGADYITAYDVVDLAPVVVAFQGPTTLKASVKVPCPKRQRFVAKLGTGRVAICSVRAIDVVKWPVTHQRHRDDLRAGARQPAELHGGGGWRNCGRSKTSATLAHALPRSVRGADTSGRGRVRTAWMAAR